MWKWGTTVGLRALSVLYMLGASAFGFGLALQAQQPWAVGAKSVAEETGPFLTETAITINEQALKPGWAFTVWAAGEAKLRAERQIAAWTAPKAPVAAAPAAKPIHIAKIEPKPAAPPAPKAEAKPPVAAAPSPSLQMPQMQLAQGEATTPELMPAPDATPPSPAEVGRVLAHLKTGLTRELYENFSLFLFVSKANYGPWQQRMFVFAKQPGGDMKLLHSFPVSTGQEAIVAGPTGKLLGTHTNTGFFQLDPERMYKRYTSQQWGHPMPWAMFFNWEHDGLQTGLAIHSAVGDDIQLLGKRASAGCVRLHPQNAELLFRLIKAKYRGLTPRFAYDRRTATMSTEGLLMHDQAGNIQYQDGYKVLVMIENTGGDDLVAALF
ncbi:lipoprotein-anchoring transpeptidase ErfK/SrfK [Rhizomicrobium palustre]|uniref:Lipoprotein-anchoring transpeptidase ErfK/SrfK n=1 Tax=Rhizomicrobium palustre TaxID=189966 RepID=A0A846N541_9PROT|nr:L,D-transpeptidase [Rhizomicrobium palustre]NIK90311.1 lipoprotein-anchoring transpeptidase ErfK/SrfK [Rhizomicrobium palustre]